MREHGEGLIDIMRGIRNEVFPILKIF
jgi:hypothetical protein